MPSGSPLHVWGRAASCAAAEFILNGEVKKKKKVSPTLIGDENSIV